MRQVLPPILSRGRVRAGPYRSTDADGAQGAFFVPCQETGRILRIIASDGRDWQEAGLPGEPWEHVSVSVADQSTKCPSWPEMAWVKDLFWGPGDTVMQLHVPAADHVNYHPGCLHFWRPVGQEIPRPPALTVGPPPATETRPECVP